MIWLGLLAESQEASSCNNMQNFRFHLHVQAVDQRDRIADLQSAPHRVAVSPLTLHGRLMLWLMRCVRKSAIATEDRSTDLTSQFGCR